MNGKCRHCRVKRTTWQRLTEISHDGCGRSHRQALTRLGEHLRRPVYEHQLCVWVASKHSSTHQPRTGPEIEHTPHWTLAQPDHRHGRPIELIEAGHQASALRIVIPGVGSKNRNRIRHATYAITYKYMLPQRCTRPMDPVTFSVSPLDVWSALGATGWQFGDGSSASGAGSHTPTQAPALTR